MKMSVSDFYVFDANREKHRVAVTSMDLTRTEIPNGNDELKLFKPPEKLTFTCRLIIQPKSKIHIFGVTNNTIRLHGGRPMRTIPRRFL